MISEGGLKQHDQNNNNNKVIHIIFMMMTTIIFIIIKTPSSKGGLSFKPMLFNSALSLTSFVTQANTITE